MEIERKFLVAERPGLEGATPVAIEQGYLALADGRGGAEVRLRKGGGELLLTVKGGAGRSRTEEEIPLDPRRFASLWPLTEGRRVEKDRYRIPHGGLEVELDVYRGALEGLLTAEVEFPDDETADAFEAPPWLGQEVTGDARYLNATLATEGAPR
jgi:CYTH domain-containing protein